ncbi:MAG: 50S ribosomal protein L20 [Proteobacteria bacterium]|nr:50S ribosomal protein L20 [Pseudomonadota bacterium]
MSRVKRAVHARKKKKAFFKAAKGYRGGRSRLLRTVKEAVDRARCYAYRDRRTKKREFRSLWIIRINAAARICGISYSKLMYGLKLANVEIDRKSLADLAVFDLEAFRNIADVAKAKL